MSDAKPETPETPDAPIDEVIVVDAPIEDVDAVDSSVDEVIVVDEIVEVTEVDVQESAAGAPPPAAPAPPPPPPAAPAPPVSVADEAPVEPAYTAAAPPQQVVYVQAPVPPRPAGNRGIGALYAVIAAVVYGILLAGAAWVIQYAFTGETGTAFLANEYIYIPIAVFAIALIVVVVVVNRAGWGAYVLGSLFVGAAVYFGSIGIYLLIDFLVYRRGDSFDTYASEAFVIIAAILAREVALWFGWIIARRGKKVAARNAVARAEFDTKLAEFRAGAY